MCSLNVLNRPDHAIMLTSFPQLTIVLALACLSACGGNVDAPPSPALALAADAAQIPVADCEPQACRALRIIDSNAETFRADSARRDTLALAVATLDQ